MYHIFFYDTARSNRQERCKAKLETTRGHCVERYKTKQHTKVHLIHFHDDVELRVGDRN